MSIHPITLDAYETICSELADTYFPKGHCKERGPLLAFIAMLWVRMHEEKVEEVWNGGLQG